MNAIAMNLTMMVAVTDRPPRRPLVCFATIPPSQWSIHDRLLNWAKWARGSENQSGGTDSPTFCKFIPDEPRSGGHEAELTYVPLDTDDAIKVAKAVGHLPPQKRASIHWYYLKGGRHPAGKAKEMGIEVQRLSDLVRDARTLLIQWCG